MKKRGLWLSTCPISPRLNHPFILRPRFLQFLEIWFEKSGARYLVREIWCEKSGSRNLVQEIWFEKSAGPEKNPSLQNHFSGTTFLHFPRIVVAE